jgi:nucleoside-diphosphate-sugar epimerase
VKIEYSTSRAGDFSGKEVSNERANKELGWEPKVSFEEGLRRYIEWYMERQEKREKDWEKLDEMLRLKISE